MVPGQEAEDVEPLGRAGRKFDDGADGLPGIGHRGHAAKARAVEVEKVHQSGIPEALQGLLVVLLAGEGVRVAAALQRTVAAVPRVAEPFFKGAAQRLQAGGFAGCCLQGGLDPARVSVNEVLELRDFPVRVDGIPAGAGPSEQTYQP